MKVFHLISSLKSSGVILWRNFIAALAMGCMIAGPMMSCRPMLLQEPVVTSTQGAVSTAEGENVQAVAAGAVERVVVEKSETKADRVIVSAGLPIVKRATVAEAKSFFLKPAISGGKPLPKGLNTENGQTTEMNGLSFTLSDDHALSEPEKATYNAIIEDIAQNQDLSAEETTNKVSKAIDQSELAGIIENSLTEGTRSAGFSRLMSEDSQAEPTQEEIDALTAEVQAALNSYSSTIVTQVFPVAEEHRSTALESMQDTLNNPSEEQTDAVATAMDKAILEYNAKGKASSSRNTSQYATMVSTREGFLSWVTDTASGQGDSGDLLWIYAGDFTHLVITGHAAVYNQKRGLWLTADSHVKVNDGATAITDYFSSDSQIIRQNLNKNMKLLRVNSSKTYEERRSAVQSVYDKYYGKGYWVNLLKDLDWIGLYCSQVCYFVWKSMGTNIDGTWLPSSFLLQNIVSYTIPVTISIGFWKVTIYVVIFVIIITILTFDIIYPWDIVIDDNTIELLRFDE